jgi:hypothetical protein
MWILRQWFDRFEKSGHDQCADLKVNGVGVGSGAGKVAEAAVGVAAC